MGTRNHNKSEIFLEYQQVIETRQLHSVIYLDLLINLPQILSQKGRRVTVMTGPSKLAAYSDLFERLGDITFLVEPGTLCVLEANPACERVIGVSTESLVGENVLKWLAPQDQDSFEKALRVSMRRFHPRQFESKWIIGEKTYVMDILACPLSLSDGTQVIQIIARDITFRREAESKMADLVTQLETANQKLQVLSTTDEMTGLHNYRYFKDRLEEEHARAARYKQIYAVIFCDIDHFKHYNDRNGHPAGDALLKEIGQVIKSCIRNTDFCARYGGEEFVVLCPAVDSAGARVAAERIRTTIAAHEFKQGEHQPMGHISVSIGVADFPTHGKTTTEVLESADQALYLSKRRGRNQITLFKAPEESVSDPIKKAS